MLTSAGRSRRMSESTAFGVGSMMSISRLCVRISKCSRLSLYLWGDRMTTTTFFSVGSGTGPTTWAPARVTVSTIFRAELSRPAWSYDFSRMRIFCPAMDSSALVRAPCCVAHAVRGWSSGRFPPRPFRRDAIRTAVLLSHGVEARRTASPGRGRSDPRRPHPADPVRRAPAHAPASSGDDARSAECSAARGLTVTGYALPDSDPGSAHSARSPECGTRISCHAPEGVATRACRLRAPRARFPLSAYDARTSRAPRAVLVASRGMHAYRATPELPRQGSASSRNAGRRQDRAESAGAEVGPVPSGESGDATAHSVLPV